MDQQMNMPTNKPMGKMIWAAKDLHAGWNEAEGRITKLNLEIRQGERIAFIGPENSGRGIALRVLAGLRPVKQGTLKFLDWEVPILDVNRDWDFLIPMDLRKAMAVSLKSDGLLSNVSLREGLELLVRFQDGDHTEELRQQAHKRVTELCAKFGLESSMDRRPVVLSNVERRLGSLVRALLSNPNIMILENPSQDLGDGSLQRLWGALSGLAENKEMTMIISTDDWLIASQFCSRWVVFEGDEVVYDGLWQDFIHSKPSMVSTIVEHYRSRRSFEQSLLKELSL